MAANGELEMPSTRHRGEVRVDRVALVCGLPRDLVSRIVLLVLDTRGAII